MEVVSVREVYIDGVRVTHCPVIFCKKTFDVNGKRTLSISLPEEDGTSKLMFSAEDVKKVFFYPEKDTIGFVFSSNSAKKSFIINMDMSGLFLKDCYDDFNQLKRILSRTFIHLNQTFSLRSTIKEKRRNL